jgi:DNA polymerase
VLKNEEPISKIRGQWFKLPGTDINVMPIFHPSYLLRNASKDVGSPKWLTWQDMKEVRGALDFFKAAKDLGA